MSEVGVLSQEYKTASELSQAITLALIALKKRRLNVVDGERVTPEQFEASRHRFADILFALAELLEPTGSRRATSAASVRVPGALVTRLKEERRGDLAYYLEDVHRVATRLREHPSELTDADFAVLEELAGVADAEASSIFQRLMRE